MNALGKNLKGRYINKGPNVQYLSKYFEQFNYTSCTCSYIK